MVIDLQDYVSTFSRTSYDGMKKESLIHENYYVIYNFDDIAKDVCQLYRAGEYLASADALSFSHGNIYLIEFKNQPTRNIDRRVIQKKAFDSIYLLQQALFPDESISKLRDKVIFYVLYSGSSNPSFDKFKSKANSFAHKEKEPLEFGLSKYREFYKEIYTISGKEFERNHITKVI